MYATFTTVCTIDRQLVHSRSPKCEIFNLFDFNDFYFMKCLKVGDLAAEIKNIFFLFGPDTYHFIFLSILYVQCTLATIFDFDLSQKKLFQVRFRSTFMSK